ncbi:hypothetical protein GGR52DRAFT_532841 [Hypoxylon sp. FL1284]|nr:hypothetical protein GGR52DRAFT_532841 [Hypoxylon sp. FL1284]
MEFSSSLAKHDEPSLVTLPAEVLHLVIPFLDTARSLSHLSQTCKRLYHLISDDGWRIFVISRFNSFSHPGVCSPDRWAERARALTSQSRDWERRAIIVAVLQPSEKGHSRSNRSAHPPQSIASNMVVDAHHRRNGNDAQDLIFWGAGEDVFGLIRHGRGSNAPEEEWLSCKGVSAGYRPGKDDVTSVSILKSDRYAYGKGDDSQVLVGRANGDLDLLSMSPGDFGKKLLRFRGVTTTPSVTNSNTLLTEIQSLDVNYQHGVLAAATKQGLCFYNLTDAERDDSHVPDEGNTDTIHTSSDGADQVWADDAIHLKEVSQGPWSFEFIRSIKFVNETTLAVGLNKSGNPLQFLERTRTGFEKSSAYKVSSEHQASDNYDSRTVRAVLPVDTSSLASGGGNSVLSSWDDGTVRLLDLRTPSHADSMFQDNFDLTTPINSLLSRGLERFYAGSAYSPVVKVFDYRWPKGYYHTEALPCGIDRPHQPPRPPTVVEEPYYAEMTKQCDYVAGRLCRWHVLSRHDFYRPNMTIWLPASKASRGSPVYSLVSPSDESPSLFAGLSGSLVEMMAMSGLRLESQWQAHAGPQQSIAYQRMPGKLAFIETGSGFPVDDVAKSRRVPPMYIQTPSKRKEVIGLGRKRAHIRLDEWLNVTN